MCERRRTHQGNPSPYRQPMGCPSPTLRTLTQSAPSRLLGCPLGYTLCYTLVLLLFHVCNAISMQCGYLAASFLSFRCFYSYSHCFFFFFFLYFFFLFFFCVFPTFFYPNSTLTHRKMPIRNVSSEKEKLKLATIFFHAGSLSLSFSLCLSLSQSHPCTGIVSFHFLLIFHLK